MALQGNGPPIYSKFPDLADWLAPHEFRQWTSLDDAEDRISRIRRASGPEILAKAVEIATRAAAVDTNAIEGSYIVNRGFTMTVAYQAANWELVVAERGHSAMRHLEDALAAYELVLDAATGSTPISEQWIRELHAVACASQETYRVLTEHGWQDRALPKGQYKTEPNSPMNSDTGRMHAYAPVIDVSSEMHRLVENLRTPLFAELRPYLQAAYVHYAFVCVHPFSDGNGRVARALASTFLYRSPGVPLLIYADETNLYLDASEEADSGNPQPFIDFVAERVLDVVQMVELTAMQAMANNSKDAAVATLHRAMAAGQGISHEALDQLARQLLDAIASYGSDIVASTAPTLPGNSNLMLQRYTSNLVIPSDIQSHRSIGAPSGGVQVSATCENPVTVVATRQISVAISKGSVSIGSDHESNFVLYSNSNNADERFSILLSEMYPRVRAVAHQKVELFVDSVIASLLTEFTARMVDALRNAGFID